jgi:glucose-1-phosphate cytidylyltransferase
MYYKTAVILCGGKGSRLGQLGKKIPKTLIKIHGRPIIWYIIKSLAKNSINHFVLPLGYKGKMIKNYLNNNKEFKNYKIDLMDTGIETEISQRIFKIRNKIKSENFVLLNGDAIFDFNLKSIFNIHSKKNLDTTFLGCSAPLSYGVVGKIKNKIVSFEREIQFNKVKSEKRAKFTGHIFSGISVIKSNLILKNFKSNCNFEREFYPKIIQRNKTNFKEINGFWYSIDNEKDIKNLNVKFNNKNFSKIKTIKNKLKK